MGMTAAIAHKLAVQERNERKYFVAAALPAEGWLAFSSENIRLARQGLLSADRLLPCFCDSTFQQVRYT
jgi:hypothetical protein